MYVYVYILKKIVLNLPIFSLQHQLMTPEGAPRQKKKVLLSILFSCALGYSWYKLRKKYF